MQGQPVEQYEIIPDEEVITVLPDRRARPYIRTRKRRNFDRRKSYRVGTSARVLFYGGGESRTGLLRDISETGACVELETARKDERLFKRMEVPFLQDNKIKFEISWSKNGNDAGRSTNERFGVKFLGLTPTEKIQLRKRFLLADYVLLSYSEEVTQKISNSKKRQKIESFFLNDLKITLEKLLDIEIMITEKVSDEIIMQECRDVLDALVKAGDKLNSLLNSEAMIKEIKQRSRALLGHFLFQSNNFKRGFEKPRGYPGDYKMLEMVYDDQELSQGIGKFIDRYGLDVPYSVGIRARKDSMKEYLYNFINNSTEEHLSIVNLASGGCRDIRELFKLPIHYKGKAQITCIDQDEDAINFSKRKLSASAKRNIPINFIQGNILRLGELDIGNNNSIDLIYSIGIADYLQDRMLKKIFRDCYNLIKPGGKLVVAYKDKDKHRPLELDWYADWCFIPRNEQELINIIHESMGKEKISIEVRRINSGIIFFAEVTKL